MDSILVIIGDVVPHQTAQMNFIEDDHMVEKIAATTLDRAFGNPVLLWTRGACPCGLRAAGGKQIGYLFAKLGIAIVNHISVWSWFLKSFSQLLHNPMFSRMFCHIEMEDVSAAVFDSKETIQDSEGESRYGEEVRGRDDLAVIARESDPEFPCRP